MNGLTLWEGTVAAGYGLAIMMGVAVLAAVAWMAWQDHKLTRQYGHKAIDDVQAMLDAELPGEDLADLDHSDLDEQEAV